MKIVLLGRSGMIGSGLADLLASHEISFSTIGRNFINDINCDFLSDSFEGLEQNLKKISPNFIVNLSGVTKQKIVNTTDGITATKMNALLPGFLEGISTEINAKVITVATDCVFSGDTGRYFENSPKDGSDIYAVTKILGEQLSPNTMHLRTSVVGFGSKDKSSLFDWFSSLLPTTSCRGFSNHLWNGVTRESAAQIILGIIKDGLFKSGVTHLTPANYVSKYELLTILQQHLDLPTARIIPSESELKIDRRLETHNPEFNQQLWHSAGYKIVPDIQMLIREMSKSSS